MNNKEDCIELELPVRIDSRNAAQTENDILDQIDGLEGCRVLLDAGRLTYISSAGLRIILRLVRKWPDLVIENVSPDIYEILEMTRFSEMVTVKTGGA